MNGILKPARTDKGREDDIGDGEREQVCHLEDEEEGRVADDMCHL